MIIKCIICNKEKHSSLIYPFCEGSNQICIKCFLKEIEKKKLWEEYNQEVNKDPIIEAIKTKKKKKNYPKEFSDKRKILLANARSNDWCTACWTIELLQVHHIDKNKFNNDDLNLLVLCYYCHSKEHKHMQWKKPAKWIK